MKGLDTNVLVRYLTQDDARQALRASACIEDAIKRGESCFVNPVVLAELIWVLEECYGYGKAQLLELLGKLLAARQLEIAQKDCVRKAVEDYRQSRADFADCLIGWINQQSGCKYTYTFDKALQRIPTFQQL
jgi:predicted nucleic-acid-binding protein